MNTSQLLAWLTCLSLAFFAAALSLHNAYKTKVLEARLIAVSKVVQHQGELLVDIHQVLWQIEGNLREEPPAPERPAE